jgi:hypothetical protein
VLSRLSGEVEAAQGTAGETQLDRAYLGQPGLLRGIEPDVKGTKVVVELSQAASSHNRCGDSGVEQCPGKRDPRGGGAELGGDVLHHRGDVQPAR